MNDKYELDAAMLPQPIQTEIESLIASLVGAPRPVTNSALRDAIGYVLTINWNGRQEEIAADYGTVPLFMQQLIMLIKTHGKHMPKRTT